MLLFGSPVFAQTLTPSPLAFGNQTLNTSASKTATFKNTLTKAVSIASITIVGTNQADFALGGGCQPTPFTLAAGKTCSITVTFTPSKLASETATLTVSVTGAGSGLAAALTGTGTSPVTLAPATLAFGNQAEGTHSATQTATLTNLQAKALTISSIAVSGPFSQSGGTCPLQPSTLAASTSCTVILAFSPTAVTAQSGTLTITDNSASSPHTASLTGTGTTPVTVSPTSVNSGTVAIGNTSAATTVTLKNQENIALKFTSIAASGPFALTANTCGTSIAAGGSCTVGVTFAPVALGAATGALNFTDNAANSPQAVSLAGTGSAPLTLSASSLVFTSTTLGVSAVQTLTLTNGLSAAMTFGAIAATGDFAVSSNTCGSKVAAGAQCKVGITITPTVVGARSGTLTINYGAFGSPAKVALSGTGNATGLTSITVTPLKTTIPLGTTQQYAANGKFSSGSTVNVTASVTWTSSAVAVASINAAGLASSAGQGSTTVKATLGSINGNTTLTVSAPALVSLALTPLASSISLGTTQQLTATGTYTDGSTQNLTGSVKWSSSATAFATINSTGLASAAGIGTTTIQAASGSINVSTTLAVTAGFTLTGNLNAPRFAPTATMLNNGLVLIAGGVGSNGNSLASAELYNPVSGVSTPTGSLNAARAWHTATLLNNGTVLIAGGCSGCPPGSNGTSLANAEIYNPASGVFTATGNMTSAREYHTATLLNNGLVLMAGGLASGASLNTAEVYNPAEGTFTATGSLNNARYWQAATLLKDGTVLVTGGQMDSQTLASPAAEIYNTSMGVFTLTANTMNAARSQHTATLLNGGQVLIAGGNGSAGPVAAAELYDPVAGTFTVTGSLFTPRYGQPATLMNNGRVLLAGGLDVNGNSLASAELFDSTKGGFISTGGLHATRFGNTSLLLSNGMIFNAGGITMTAGNFSGVTYNASAEQYQPAAFAPPGLVSIAVTPAIPALPQGDTQPFVATGTFSDSSTQTLAGVIWSSSKTTVAAVSNDVTNPGAAYATATGSATISACAGTLCGSAALTVGPPALVSIVVTPASGSVAAGSPLQFTAMGTYTDGSTQNLTASATWSSSMPNVATINSAGLATSLIAGGTTIQAASGSVEGSTSLTVNPPALVSIAVTPAAPSIALGLSQQFAATGTYTDGSTQNLTASVTWASAAKAVATISSAGLAASVKQGSATITASLSGVQGTANLGVTAPVITSISVTPAAPSIASGLSQQFTATGSFTDGSKKNVTSSAVWTSSVTAIASINNAGLATSLTPGGTTIQAAIGSIYGSSSLTVTPPTLVSIAITPATPSIPMGMTQQFTATGTYTDSSTQDMTTSVTWNSSLTGVASVNTTGLASAAGIGSTSIQAASGAVNSSTTLTVTAGFVVTGSLNIPRFAHTATMLNNGLILIAGGIGSDGNSLASAELYNPITAVSTPTGNLNTPRASHTATLLDNGTVLIAGGCSGCPPGANGTSLADAEIYDPATGMFTPTGSMTTPREYHTATLLNNGLVLITGGLASGASLNSAEVYSPAAGTFTATGSLNNARYWQAATLLNDGTVLITGGQMDGQTWAPPAAEIYNASTGVFTLTANNMISARSQHTATLLNGGMVLLAGGNGAAGPIGAAELYDPVAGTFTVTGSLITPRYAQPATLMSNGIVLLAGGLDGNANSLDSAELFDPTQGMFLSTGGLNTARFGNTSLLLGNGTVLSAGGITVTAGDFSNVTYAANAEQYQPATLAPPGLVSIALSPANPTLPVGITQNFVATGTFSDTSTQTLAGVIWSSTNNAAASVGDDSTNMGTAYAVATGSTTISACAGSLCGSTTVAVNPPILVSIAVNPNSGSIPAGTPQQFTAMGTYSDGSTQDLTASSIWSSSTTTVATINNSALATSFITGTTTIQAAVGSIQGSTLLTVTAPVLVSIAVTPPTPSVALGLSQQFTATGTYTDGSTQDLTSSVTWGSSMPNVATISGAGMASSVNQGSTSIAASLGAVQAGTSFNVTAAALTAINVAPAAPSVALGLTQPFTATGIYTDGSTQNLTGSVTWTSSLASVATISAAGLASSAGQGGTTIQAVLGPIQGSTSLTITGPALVSIAATPANPIMPTGTTQQFIATGTYTDNSTQDVTSSATWSSSAMDIATVDNAGMVTGLTAGPTTISAAMGSISGSVSLNVFAGANFYVALNGNDQWSGTLPAPNADQQRWTLRVPGHGSKRPANPPERQSRSPLSIHGEEWDLLSSREPDESRHGLILLPPIQELPTMQVTWQNYPGETPVISGGIPLSNSWTNMSGNLWQIQLPSNTQPFEYLFYNGQRRLCAPGRRTNRCRLLHE